MKFSTVISLCLMIDVWLQVSRVESHWFWGRRRRRRSPPPPPVIHCKWTQWSSWTQCSKYCGVTGSQSRSRTIATPASGGGRDCSGSKTETRSCTITNNCKGPSSRCDSSNGRCSCSNSGYELSGNTCKDKNECGSNSGKGPCDHICTNTQGSYSCSCKPGYSLSKPHACVLKNCGSLTTPTCPSSSYEDSFSKACMKVSVSCPSGTKFQQTCSLSCSNGYQVGKITSQQGQKFGQDFNKVDFTSVKTTTTCSLQQGGSGVAWDIASQVGSYYCRRVNDPPIGIALSSNTLPEHSPSGHVIGKLTSTDMQQSQRFTYSVETYSVLFTAQGDTLKSTWKDPDLQGTIPLQNGRINITIRSKDNGNPQMWIDKVITIQVTDVNDPPDNITLSKDEVYENATIGDVIGVFKAQDKDDPPGTPASSSAFNWTLKKDSKGMFVVKGAQLIVNKKLDHESDKIHHIIVTATDTGRPPKTSQQDFYINVRDINELPVSITLSKSSVDENSKQGTIVGTLTATDDDNDPISFSLSQSPNLTLSKFELSTTSCSSVGQSKTCKSDVKVKGDLDYEERNSYQLVVVAGDKTGQIIKEWTINIVNKNEKPTKITLTGLHEISENSLNGTTVGNFLVTDPDNKNSNIQSHKCSLISGDVDYFTIDAKTVLKVSGGKTLDFEAKKELKITVKCIDDGKNPVNLFVTRSFVIKVKGVNEPPTSISLSKLTIPENSPRDTLVGKLSCDDPEKAYQNYTYKIQGPKDTPFKLGGQGNDEVLVNGQLDYEKAKVLSLTIRVTDSGGLYFDKKFQIAVQDVNEPPKGIILPGKNGTLSIQEESLGNFISLIQLDDEDAGDKYPKDCQLLDDAQQRVQIVQLVLVSGPKKTDFETSNGSLSIMLKCSDSAGKYVSQSFNITITDVNERPTDIKLDKNTVPENQDDMRIGTVTVTDPDTHQTHQCTVCEVSNPQTCSPSQNFEVNSAMELQTKKALNYEKKNSYDIKIKCTDQPSQQAGPVMSKQKPFTVVVTDVNEPPSSLCSSPITVSIHDSNGAIITTVNASDPDNERNDKQRLSYSMDDSLYGGVFQLKDNHIFKSKEISKIQNFSLAITVTDDGRIVSDKGGYIFTNPLSRIFNCTVIITDSQPSTDIRLTSNTVSIMAPKGTTIGLLSTVSGTQGEVYRYSLLDNKLKPFAVDGNKLNVAFTHVPHVGISSLISKDLFEDVLIQSIDSKSRILTKRIVIRIKNDAPAIEMCLVKPSINENEPKDTIVGQILIEDPLPAKYQCKKTSCCAQIGNVPADTFKYNCHANNPDDNAIIVPKNNITALFYVDDRYTLRTKVRFNYQDYVDVKGKLTASLSCHDLQRPLHMIWKTVTIKIIDCDANNNCPHPSECARCNNGGTCQDDIGSYSCVCPAGYTGEHCEVDINYCQPNLCQYGSSCVDLKTSFKCECKPKYSGFLCNKNEELCKDCKSDTLCVKFVDAAKRCLSADYQVPILVDGKELTPQQLLNIENEIASLVESSESKRSRRSSKLRYHAETLKTKSVSDKTLLYLAIMDSNNGYEPLLATQACTLLKDTSRHCIDKTDCGTIKESGEKCPVIGSAKASAAARKKEGLSDGASAGVGLVVVFVIVALLIGAVFYYRRKAQKAKACDDQNVVYNPNQESVDFQNPVYAEGNVNNAVQLQDMVNDRLGKEDLVHANLDPNSVKKRNDIKVTDNALYVPPSGPALSAENPSYISAGAAAEYIPKKNNIDDEKQINIDPKTGKAFSLSLDNTYENPDDFKGKTSQDIDPKTGKPFSVSMDDNDYENPDDLKGKSHVTKGNAMNGHADKKQPRRERESRYEQNPVVLFPKRKGRNDYENADECSAAVGNPLYDTSSGLPGDPIYENIVKTPGDVDKDFKIDEDTRDNSVGNPLYSASSGLSMDPRKHTYDNVIKTPKDMEKDFGTFEDIGDNSIVNPLYEIADPTGEVDSEPLYEDIPAVELSPTSKKPKKKGFRRSNSSEKGYEELDKDGKKGFRRSISLEKASGYEELDKDGKKGFQRSISLEKASGYEELDKDGVNQLDDDDVFSDSQA